MIQIFRKKKGEAVQKIEIEAHIKKSLDTALVGVAALETFLNTLLTYRESCKVSQDDEKAIIEILGLIKEVTDKLKKFLKSKQQ